MLIQQPKEPSPKVPLSGSEDSQLRQATPANIGYSHTALRIWTYSWQSVTMSMRLQKQPYLQNTQIKCVQNRSKSFPLLLRTTLRLGKFSLQNKTDQIKQKSLFFVFQYMSVFSVRQLDSHPLSYFSMGLDIWSSTLSGIVLEATRLKPSQSVWGPRKSSGGEFYHEKMGHT